MVSRRNSHCSCAEERPTIFQFLSSNATTTDLKKTRSSKAMKLGQFNCPVRLLGFKLSKRSICANLMKEMLAVNPGELNEKMYFFDAPPKERWGFFRVFPSHQRSIQLFISFTGVMVSFTAVTARGGLQKTIGSFSNDDGNGNENVM